LADFKAVEGCDQSWAQPSLDHYFERLCTQIDSFRPHGAAVMWEFTPTDGDRNPLETTREARPKSWASPVSPASSDVGDRARHRPESGALSGPLVTTHREVGHFNPQ
jgi:hypothetical protein